MSTIVNVRSIPSSRENQLLLRGCIVRPQHGDSSAWRDFFELLASHRDLTFQVRCLLEEAGWLEQDLETDQFSFREFPANTAHLPADDERAFLDLLWKHFRRGDVPDELPQHPEEVRSEIMYIEMKLGLRGPARIGRVTFSKSGRTIYYRGHRFQSLKGGYKANFEDMDTGAKYWISRCKSDGQDTLYPAIVEIDDDAREQYWMTIRKRPDLIKQSSFRSEGKHSKRRPR